jgi:hypothetical protein
MTKPDKHVFNIKNWTSTKVNVTCPLDKSGSRCPDFTQQSAPHHPQAVGPIAATAHAAASQRLLTLPLQESCQLLHPGHCPDT